MYRGFGMLKSLRWFTPGGLVSRYGWFRLADEVIRRLLVKVPEMSYRPNKLHGDELVVDGGTAYRQAGDEWLDADQIDALLQFDPTVPLVMIDMNPPSPGVYRFRSMGADGWNSDIRRYYISDDGYPPPGSEVCLSAHLWTDPTGDQLLLFDLEC